MKQCTLCGRAGTRMFTALGQGGFVCTFNRACGLRRKRGLPRRMRTA